MSYSAISPDLIASYKDANYQAITEAGSITLHINQYSASLFRLLVKKDYQCAAFITAFNPRSQQQNHQENLASHTQLHAALTQHSNTIFYGVSTDPTKVWLAEKSFLALGVDLRTAKILGQRFGQNAIVWIDADAIPRLILLH